jgi:Mor family transcriptional regulator
MGQKYKEAEREVQRALAARAEKLAKEKSGGTAKEAPAIDLSARDAQIVKQRQEGQRVVDICKVFGLSRRRVYRILQEAQVADAESAEPVEPAQVVKEGE